MRKTNVYLFTAICTDRECIQNDAQDDVQRVTPAGTSVE